VLLVIFGAGASYDSVLHLPPPCPSTGAQSNFGSPSPPAREVHEDSRPPLANQLLDNRGLFVAVMNSYVACKPLVNRLRGDVQVEQQLARFEQEANSYPLRRSQLAAIRYYLHHMLWNCQNEWRRHHRGITNYSTFLDAIERWRYQTQEHVCFVTFNYDTMLERSITDLRGYSFDDFDAYISHPHFKLIKLHGSIDWGLPLNGPARRPPVQIIDEAMKSVDIDVSEQYQKVVRPPVVFEDGNVGFPALAIPVERKDVFSCPPEHLQVLADALPRVTKVITVGWRATEQHFLTMLKKPLTGLQGDVDLMVISGDDKGMRETVNNLAIGPPNSQRKRALRQDGFSGLIREIGHLESFLQ
jgi:hypothetical protein